MAKHNYRRLAAVIVSVVGFGISLVFNGLSVVGIGKSDLLVKLKGCKVITVNIHLRKMHT